MKTTANPAKLTELSTLMRLCGCQTIDALTREALILFGWAAAETSNGGVVASVEEKAERYCEIQTPALLQARTQTTETISDTDELVVSLGEIESSDTAVVLADRIGKLCGTSDLKLIVNEALTFLKHAADAVRIGKEIAAVYETEKRYKPILTPALEHARSLN